MTIEQAISKYLKDNRIKISLVAVNAEIHPKSLYASLSGHRRLRADEYLSICEFLGKDPRYFRQSA